MFRAMGRFVGGYAWSRRDLRLLYVALFLSFFGASITFPLRMLYAEAHHATPAQLGLLAAAFLVGPLVAQIPMGWLVDRWGRVPVLLVVLVAHPIISILYIPLNSPVELIVLRFLEGVTIAGVIPAVNAYIADVTPEEHRSEAFGAYTATLNGGLLLGPLVGGIIGQEFGFATAFVVNFLIEALAVPIVLGHIHEPAVHRERGRLGDWVPWRELFSLPLVAVYASFFAVQVAFGILGGLWAIWINDLGGSYTYIGFTFSVFAVPQIILGAAAGRIADRWGRGRVILLSGVAAGAIYASYGIMHNLVLIAALGVVEGIVMVFQQPIAQALLADASPARARGRVQGLAGFLGSVGGASAAFAALPLYHDNHAIPFVGAGIVMAAGGVVTAIGALALVRRRAAEQAREGDLVSVG